ncbi:hypothetical protein AB0478_46950 [Streptomyces sp. NPDC051917]|uniref:hypothetical protein n=1 Tax=Streptomyces sp. NPDC051917 TaxID=3154754 RepID=UPI003456E838
MRQFLRWAAQDAAQSQGFSSLTSHDALGRGRRQAFDRNWKVCSHNTAAATMVPTDTPLDFGTVKLEEAGPAKDQTVPPAAAGTMPNSKGKSVKAAHAALDTSTSMSVKDATAEDRWVPVVSNRRFAVRCSDRLLGVSRYRVPSDGTQWAGAGSEDGCHSRLISP